jgi:methylmalonyl-CoA/ethylmalonyl-CoA epimerase
VFGGINPWGRHLAVQVEFPGGGRVELLQPLPGISPSIGNFLERNPRGGLHHITFKVPDIHVALAAVGDHGLSPVMTYLENDVWMETYLHPRETHGVLIQLAQSSVDAGPIPGFSLEELIAAAEQTPAT